MQKYEQETDVLVVNSNMTHTLHCFAEVHLVCVMRQSEIAAHRTGNTCSTSAPLKSSACSCLFKAYLVGVLRFIINIYTFSHLITFAYRIDQITRCRHSVQIGTNEPSIVRLILPYLVTTIFVNWPKHLADTAFRHSLHFSGAYSW